MALSYLSQAFGAEWRSQIPSSCFANIPVQTIEQLEWLLRRGPGHPQTSSCGRSFDAVAALALGRTHVTYEAQARDAGANQVFSDSGEIAEELRTEVPKGFDKVLEMVGVTTLRDSLRCCKKGGLVCMTGIVGNKWSLEEFEPMAFIPSTVGLTVYAGEVEDFMGMPLNNLVDQIASGTLKVQIGQTFHLDQIVEAHQLMESNKAGGKIVVLT